MKGLLFTYLGTAGGAAVGLFNPWYALLVYISFALIKPEAMWPWAVQPGRYSLMIAASMLVGWCFTRKADFQFGKSFSVFGLLLAFLGWATFGAVFPPDQELAWDFVDRLAKIVIPMLIGLTCITSTQRLKELAWTIVGSQGYVAYEMNSYYFGGYNILKEAGIGGVDNNSAAIALVTGLGIAFFLGLSSEKLWQKGLAFLFAALMGHAVLFSFSRGGMLGIIVTGLVTLIIVPKRPKTLALLFAGVIVATALAGEEVRERFSSSFVKKGGEREESAQSRVDLWSHCWDVMKQSPVMGCGPNHWPLVAPRYGWPLGKEAHSLWMQTGAELGFPGLALYLGFYLWCCLRLYLLTWKSTFSADPYAKTVAMMVLSGLCGFIVSAQFVSIETLEIPYYTALLGCGALKLATPRREAVSVLDFQEEFTLPISPSRPLGPAPIIV